MLLYHGTQRACYAGESGDSIQNCSNAECKFCSILKESFKISEAGCKWPSTKRSRRLNGHARSSSILETDRRPARNRHGMFGKGIYTTPIASSEPSPFSLLQVPSD